MIRTFLATSGALALAFTPPGALPALADVKGGVDAWSAGNYADAVRQWQPQADKGDPDALFNLAQAYKLGRGVPVDLRKAEELYGKAAGLGHTQAADAYGLLLFQRGDRERALPLVEASAARGDPRAQYILGVAHFNGDIVKKDWVRAYALASLARQAGLPQATAALAQMDRHIPLAERQKSVVLAQQLSTQAQANRQRLNASQELGFRLAAADPVPASTGAPEIVAADSAVRQAARTAGTVSPAAAGADYARPRQTPRIAAATISPAPPPRAAAQKPQPQPAPPGTSPVSAPMPARAAIKGPWRIQLGAFGVAGNADALWNRVKGRRELAGHARALVPAGRLTKLQATGFASKSDAEAACARMTAAGFACVPSRD